MLAPFAKKPLQLTLRGITTDDNDLSVSPTIALDICGGLTYGCITKADIIRTVTLPHLQLFGVSEGLELQVRDASFSGARLATSLYASDQEEG